MRRLAEHAELLELSGDDAWVRWAVPDPFTTEVWVHAGVSMVERRDWRRGFWVAPLRASSDAGDGVRRALTTLRDDGHLERLDSQSVSVVQEHAEVAHAVLDLGDGGDWDWMWTAQAPEPAPREAVVVELDDTADAAEISAFSREHNPRVWTEIGTGRVVRWVGVRDESGALVAVGGAELEATGAPHLAGIVTAVEVRGRGWGTVVSAALTRWAVETYGVSTLGMYSDNQAARAVYRRLGYRTARAWHSRLLTGERAQIPR